MSAPDAVWSATAPNIGLLELVPVRADRDTDLLHSWLTTEHARFWDMTDATRDDVYREYRGYEGSDVHRAYLGLRNGEPAFLTEIYDPASDPVGNAYERAPGDVGMHFLSPAPADPISGFTTAAMGSCLQYIFSSAESHRVVVEPDVRNDKVHAVNARLGFRVAADVDLPDKRARLSFCTRDDFARATGDSASDAPAHLTPDTWARVNRALAAKAIGEFAHELLIVPEPDTAGPPYYVLAADNGTHYRFRADRFALDHWSVDPAGLTRELDGQPVPVDALDFVLDFADALGINDAVLPVYLEEISSTLASAAYKLTGAAPTAADLAGADFQAIESSMTEGHPCFVANNGRIGFDPDDYSNFAPETGSRVRLVWIAVHRRNARLSMSRNVDADRFADAEFVRTGPRLAELGLDPRDYLPMPVHPWQWRKKICTTFAADIARRDIVYLGRGADTYQPQQSIRTFFNVDSPDRSYVKTALSIVNMGFMRGLSPTYMRATPAINDWLHSLLAGDTEIDRSGFSLLREVAAIGYTNPYYGRAAGYRSPYRTMLSALWRESPLPQLGSGQRLASMTSLLHIDENGHSVVSALIARSGLSAADWVRRYLDAYLRPLVHCFYAHRLVFMPHGENVILVLENGVPARIIMKDIAEEIAVFDPDVELPDGVDRIRADVPDRMQALSIFTDVFDSFFRFLAARLAADGTLPEREFWAAVADCVAGYQQSRPDLAGLFARYDLFADEFDRSCLNRLQLADNTQMVDLSDPAGGLKFAGTLQNPIAPFAPPAPGRKH